jgi:fused signal recognition particle receptor
MSDEPKKGFFSRFRKKKNQPNELLSSDTAAVVPHEYEGFLRDEGNPSTDAPAKPQERAPQEELPGPDPASEPAVIPELENAEVTSEADSPTVLSPTALASEDVGGESKGGRFFKRLKEGLSKTRQTLKSKLSVVFAAGRKIDEDLFEELEEMLISSDLGVKTTLDVLETVRLNVKRKDLRNGEELKKEIKAELLNILEKTPEKPWMLDHKPMICLIVGVNGVGKTTTIGKLANYWQCQGRTVMICAADTFRAAAVEQLQVWAERARVDFVMKPNSKDPASVVFDALAKAQRKQTDVLLIDTAGRLHNNPNLMAELEKIFRIIEKKHSNAPHHVLLILDAVTGQNGLQQAHQFIQKVGVTDLVITKLDGTAKGGIAVAISHETKLPIRFIGVGERMEDLLPFDKTAFVGSLFEDDSRSGESTKM